MLFSFFLMIRRPPRSTPFPTRRSSDLRGNLAAERQRRSGKNSPSPQEAQGQAGVQARGHLRRRIREFHALSLLDRKSTRLNSSHQIISYAVFCLKKKKKTVI